MSPTEAKEELRKSLAPGDTVYCILRHVSRSGMMRVISLQVISSGGYVRNIDHLVASLGHYRYNDRHGGLRVDGCGMDMGFALVYDLGRVLFPDGFPIELSPRYHEEIRYNPETKVDRDGGYALRYSWL